MNKKNIIGFLMILIFLTSFISASALVNPFSIGAYNIQEFFQGGWRNYDEVILFILLFILFTAAFIMALGKVFGETNRQIKVIAVVIAIMSSLSIVAMTKFSLEQFAYIALGLGFLVLVLLIQGLLVHMGMKSKFWAFILALIIALILAFLLAKLLSERPEFGFDFIEFEKGWFPRIKAPKVDFKKVDVLKGEGEKEKETTTPTAPTTTTTTASRPSLKGEEGSKINKLLWIIPLILIALGGLGFGAYKGIKKIREKPKKPKVEEKETEKNIEEVKSKINEVVNLKREILKKIMEIVDKKDRLEGDLLDLYHKTIRDPAYLLDRESDEFRNLIEQNHDAAKLLKLEIELEKKLLELMKKENELVEGGSLSKWLDAVHSFYGNKENINKETMFERLPPYKKIEVLNEDLKKIIEEGRGYDNYCRALEKLIESFRKLYSGRDKGLLSEVKKQIAIYFLIAEKEKKAEEMLGKLTKYEEIEHWFKAKKYEKWKNIRDKEGEDLKEFFKKEKELLVGETFVNKLDKVVVRRGESLYSKLHQQAIIMLYIIELIKFLESKKKSFTGLQPLKVEPKEAADPAVGVAFRTPLRVYTRIAQGIPPYECVLYIDGRPINRKRIDSTEKFPLIEWVSREFGDLAEGEHTITITATSPKDTYRRQDRKSIKVYIGITKGVYGAYGGAYGETRPEEKGVYGVYREVPKEVKGVYGAYGGAYGGKVPEEEKRGEPIKPEEKKAPKGELTEGDIEIIRQMIKSAFEEA